MVDSVNRILRVVQGWHYDSWYDKQVICKECRVVSQRGDMARIEIGGHEYYYCFNCAYDTADAARTICPACRNYHLKGGGFCDDCRKLDTSKRIAQQVHNETNRTGRTERDNLTVLEWFDTLRHYGFRCVYCRDVYTDLDHYIPFSRGGATSVDNCVPACDSCNSTKRATMPRDFLLPSDAAVIEAYLRKRGERFVMSRAINRMAVDVLNSWYYCVTRE